MAKSFTVSSKDLFDPKKNPHLKLSVKSVARNPKIRKKFVKDSSLKIDGKRYTFFQGPDRSKRLQQKMGKRLRSKGTVKSYRVLKRKNGYLLYVR